ncbi:MAG TPA: HIT family protein, partial [Candidatus Dojkabacteria bacterium]|nr:HIT family protein [Candidatus Dojkabacteria bacterium]
MHLPDCIFCQIAKGEAPSYKIWEDDDFMAFLNIFPNTKGASLVIPKQHYDSYFAEIPVDVLEELMEASQKVAKLLDEKLDDVGRTGLIFEGFGVNHIH